MQPNEKPIKRIPPKQARSSSPCAATFTLTTLLRAFLWGKSGPPPGWDGKFLLLTMLYIAIVAAVLAIIPEEPAIHAKLIIYAAMGFGWLLQRRKSS
jgi:hypothetical protein